MVATACVAPLFLMRQEERGQIPRDAMVGRVRQSEFLERRLPLPGPLGKPHSRQEAVNQQLFDFLTFHFDLQSAANDFGAGSGQVDRQSRWRI